MTPIDLLIVDDSAAIRKILQRVLQQAALPVGKVHEASDGQQALALLETVDVGLILSDINMPNMDGLELLRRLRAAEKWKNTPVVLITTEGGRSKVLEALDLQATAYVRKPFTVEQIKEKLAGLFAGAC